MTVVQVVFKSQNVVVRRIFFKDTTLLKHLLLQTNHLCGVVGGLELRLHASRPAPSLPDRHRLLAKLTQTTPHNNPTTNQPILLLGVWCSSFSWVRGVVFLMLGDLSGVCFCHFYYWCVFSCFWLLGFVSWQLQQDPREPRRPTQC